MARITSAQFPRLPLSITDEASIEAQKISATFDEFLGTIGVQRAVCKIAAAMETIDKEKSLDILMALIESYRWECPVVSDAYWKKFGREFTQEFVRYRTSNSWKERGTANNDEREKVQAAVRSVGAGKMITRRLVEEFCLLLGNRASWRRFTKFAQAENCSLDKAFDRWYPCNQGRFLIENDEQRAILRIILNGLEKLPTQKSAYELFALTERLHDEGGLNATASKAIETESSTASFAEQFLKITKVPNAKMLARNPLAKLIAATYCRELAISASQRIRFERLVLSLGLATD